MLALLLDPLKMLSNYFDVWQLGYCHQKLPLIKEAFNLLWVFPELVSVKLHVSILNFITEIVITWLYKICDQPCKKGSYSFSEFPTSVIHISWGIEASYHLHITAHNSCLLGVYLGPSFKVVLNLQAKIRDSILCAIGISFKTCFHRSTHVF